MTFTYDKQAPSTNLQKVRLLIGDTDIDNPLLEDAEIEDVFLELSNDDIYIAASQAARAIAATFSREADTAVESVKVSLSQKSKNYNNLAIQLEDQAVKQTGALGTPVVDGVSLSKMRDVRSDTDRFPSSAEVGGQDNPPRFSDKEESLC